ncbi:Transmembrane protein [Parasponia andersonii]|uniref:Transmembrane protein n=1 Tax=Parasponia andersonii TaxID=3476 RepID=A0A2P5CRN6_PARAD|nr:Transmembrane protein [Parasponia andersonii]
MTEFPETPLTTENPYNDKIDQELFNNTMKGQWNKVVEAYKNNSHAQVARITRSGDTALHRAVSDSETKIALELLEFVQPEALKNMSNEQGNTPLHLAAALGNLEICKKVLSKNVRVIGARNRDGETPLFIAALHGKEDVFFFLYGFVKEVTDEQYLRRSNGDTVLHVAISFEFFRMAFRIIQLRPDFVDSSNVYGLSPLHILASKPDAFKSSTRLGRFDRITYSCLLVVANEDKEAINSTSGEKKNKDPYPENSTRAEGFGVVQAKSR